MIFIMENLAANNSNKYLNLSRLPLLYLSKIQSNYNVQIVKEFQTPKCASEALF